MKTSKGFSPIIAIVIVLVVGLAASTAVYFTAREMATNTNKNTNQAVVNGNVNLNQNANANQNANLNSNTNAAADETASWKTYTNEKYAFEVKYPIEWKMAQNNTASKDEEISMLKNDSAAFHISISQAKTTLDEWTNKLKTETSSKENLTFNGLPAVKMIFNDFPGAPNTESYYFIKNNNLYSLSFTVPAVVDSLTESQILSTFQFTDETANWKTYRNETHNYSIKYPIDWTVSTALGIGHVQLVPPAPTGTGEIGPSIFIKYLANQDELGIVHNKKETTINGISVIQGSDDNALAETVVTYFKRDKEMIKVWWYKVYETQQYNKILNTIQFTDETASWKTYTNTKNGYSFKYPNKNWQVETKNDKDMVSYTLGWCNPECHATMTFEVRDITLEKFIEEYNAQDKIGKIFKQESFMLDRVLGKKLYGSTALGLTSVYIFVTKENKNYIIYYLDTDDVLKQILSTFQFTK